MHTFWTACGHQYLTRNEQGLLKLKPQNLLLNLPLAGAV
jgi:hypothetical protein